MNHNEHEWVFDGHGRLYDLGGEFSVETYGPPPPTRWVSVDDLPTVSGRRIALSRPNGPVYDHRAACEVYESNGGRYVNVVTEAQWWQWVAIPAAERPDRIPRARVVASRHVWAEVHGHTGSEVGEPVD